jgi:hypothetical protein
MNIIKKYPYLSIAGLVTPPYLVYRHFLSEPKIIEMRDSNTPNSSIISASVHNGIFLSRYSFWFDEGNLCGSIRYTNIGRKIILKIHVYNKDNTLIRTDVYK